MRTLSIKRERVDTVIWLDYSFARTLFQASNQRPLLAERA